MIAGLRFLKGHGTENDFVLLPDPQGTLQLTPELVRRLCDRRAGLGAVHVPYPGYPQVATAMIAGDLQLSLLPPALASAQIRAGKLRAIGTTSSVRSPLVP